MPLFTVLGLGGPPPPGARAVAFLTRDNWNDWWEFETYFDLVVFDEQGVRHEVGGVKIGSTRMVGKTPALDATFDQLPESHFSLGQGENYYETLNKIGSPMRERILEGLRDFAWDLQHFERFGAERVVTRSLLRYVAASTVRGRLNRLAHGNAELTKFSFEYYFAWKEGAATTPCIEFIVEPASLPPTNIHVLIGRNGVGKTRCLTNMVRSLVDDDVPQHEVGLFKSADATPPRDIFAGVVFVGFSAFDPFGPIVRTKAAEQAFRYSYVGLRSGAPEGKRKAAKPKTLEQLTSEFVDSAARCRIGSRLSRWTHALNTLESDPLFCEADVSSLATMGHDTNWETVAENLYDRLSSGHKIVLLTLTRLVETVEERTLVLMDEPEGHLHPPLLSALIRSVSNLLHQTNGVAIIATHSPVVLQEVPVSCVSVLRRAGLDVSAEPPEIQTFGENIGVLTREVFGLEVTRSGFHRLLEDAVQGRGATYDAVVAKFEGQLGAEARALARGLVVDAEFGDEE